MEYRINQRTKDKISMIGLGTGPLFEAGEEEAMQLLETAYQKGINYVDLATAGGKTFSYLGKAYSSVRDQMLYQIHFGADYKTGEYGWTTNLDTVKEQIDWQLKELKTNYIDYGFIHCLDEQSDWIAYQRNGVLDYLLKMKKEGVVHHIGLSSHTPKLAKEIIETGLVDQLMFSINPGYDMQYGEFANGSTSERMELYRLCEAKGIGISVMKPFSAGQLLNAKTSPFKKELSIYQCIQYALDKPGVLTVLPGIGNIKDLEEILHFFDVDPSFRDYSILGELSPENTTGTCVYCNHCQPCPAGLNIGLINKYYDLAKIGDPMAKEHYLNLDKKASDCIACGHCDQRCPFHVKQSQRMKEIASYFNE